MGVGVVLSEPISEGAPQEACRCGGGPAFDDEVIVIEESARIAGIGRIGLESFERMKGCAGPLPSIPNKLRDAKRAVALRIRRDRNRVPMLKIEVPVHAIRRFISPWVGTFLSRWRSEGSPMKLRFRGKR